MEPLEHRAKLLGFLASKPNLSEVRFSPSQSVAVYARGLEPNPESEEHFLAIIAKHGVTALALVNTNFGPEVNRAVQGAVCKVASFSRRVLSCLSRDCQLICCAGRECECHNGFVPLSVSRHL